MHFGILFVGVLLISLSFQSTKGESGMLHLVFSVLVSMSMPVLFMCECVSLMSSVYLFGGSYHVLSSSNNRL